MMLLALGYVPLVDPLLLSRAWLLLLVPLIVGVAVVYKALKLEDLAHLPREATLLSAQIVGFMVAAAATVWLLGWLF